MAGRSKNISSSAHYKCTNSMSIKKYDDNNLHNHIAESVTHAKAKELECWLGIDEAGRGPVLGPMVYGVAYSPLDNKGDLKEMGFADSKTLSEPQRDKMFDELNARTDAIGWMVKILSPHYISTCMLRRSKYNLNELSHDTAIELIQSVLKKGVRVKEVYVDTVGDPDKYQKKLKILFPDLEITVAKKADATYSIVSAASICAKVARDKATQNWKFAEKVELTEDYGSGYPGDPKTKEFLAKNVDRVFGFSKLVRFSWSTASKLLDERAVPVRWADDEEEPSSKKRKSISTYFTVNTPTIQVVPHRYFRERQLVSCTSI
ncbi:ribonuclease H2 subunit A-like [Watersipora subatra]|uniref:ribonuclease H2 subunit A-like n=1 Tax=Watersipora subatra TaxID=2589382 RepID=UPI00355C8EF6